MEQVAVEQTANADDHDRPDARRYNRLRERAALSRDKRAPLSVLARQNCSHSDREPVEDWRL